MRRELKKIKAENAALAQRVQAGRENIAQTEQHISTTVNEWKVRRKTRKSSENVKNARKKKVFHLQFFFLLQIKSKNLVICCP